MMKIQESSHRFYSKEVRFFIAILLIIGLFFRFANLEKKVYWGDESSTSRRISGYTLEEVKQEASSTGAIPVKDLQKYQRPNTEKDLTDMINSLAATAEHPPLYFLLARFWAQLWGNSVAVMRSLPALISLLAFPCIYWLCVELFELPLVGWMATGLVAISPFHILYAQEARQYSLWTVAILISSASLLRAMRVKTKSAWAMYAATLILGLYSHLFFLLTAISHGVYVFSLEKFRASKTFISYLLASLTAILLFIPWLLIALANLSTVDEATEWMRSTFPIQSLVRTWILNLSRIFVDFNYSFKYRNFGLYIAIFLSLILVIYAIYFLCRRTEKHVWLFILTMLGVTAIALTLPDLISGGRRSAVARYLIPCYLAIEIAIAYLLAAKISSFSAKNWQRWLWQIATVVIISGGVLSSAVSSQAQEWWNKYNSCHYKEIAQIVNQANYPLYIWYNLPPFSLTYLLDPKVKLQSVSNQPVLKPGEEIDSKLPINSIANDFSDVFVDSKKALKAVLDREPSYQIKKVYEWEQQIDPVYITKTTLWHLAKQ
ncbi:MULTISPECIES: glycosyltransferase family 39 protein [unclassified Coleofasciculus]|uniref:glycosyltransferase family 39 protein n=1 Tax=Cyanophyceae TaxID=3028117 RepID=UPI001687260F|nr:MULTISPECIES: glycosyltransferase family 39 protein [unclassified Coleofasciculus]MBD2084318.1 glycosyltransferase family 39 protein [Coleofasciculus sp. FACHB-542]MBD2537440.1 glycosyltransferase family 39 protein [Coleofasciculus sp. FACHB-SPT36]